MILLYYFMLKKFWNVLKAKKGKILINIVLLFSLKTGVKVKNFDFEMDSARIERVIEFIETDNDLTVERIFEIKGGDESIFVEGLTTNNGGVGRNIRRKAYSKLVDGKKPNTSPSPDSMSVGITSSTELRARVYSPNGEEISNNPSNLNTRGQTHPSRKSYGKIMRELECQANNTKVRLDFDDGTYEIENSDLVGADELSDKLADQIYDEIRVSKNDVADIARNLGYKEMNIEKVKNHVFKNKHYLDRLFPLEPVEYRKFDSDLQQALAWKRLEYGVHTEEDKIWLMHEYAEYHHEKIHNSGYSETHDRAQKRFNGAPWKNNY